MNIHHNLTEKDRQKIYIKSSLEHHRQIQQIKDCGWIFDKINSMTIDFYENGEINGRSYVKIPLRSNTTLNIEKIDKYCFLWSIIASLHPCIIIHPNIVSNYSKFF